MKSWGSRIDVAETEALRAWVGKATDALGGLDIFVANVSALAQSMDDDSWRRSLEIDIMGTVAGVEAAIPFLEQSTGGDLIKQERNPLTGDAPGACTDRRGRDPPLDE